MGTEGVIQNLKNNLAVLDQADREKLYRKELGTGSLAVEMGEREKRIDALKKLALQYAADVDDDTVNQLAAIFGQIGGVMAAQAKRDDPGFLTERKNVLNNIDAQLEASKRWRGPFITAALEARGFLEDEGIRQQYQATVESLRTETQTTLTQVKAEAERAIAEAAKLAKEIEDRARRTATRISVEEAQKQFREAQTQLESRVRLWGSLSGTSIVAFFALTVFLWLGPVWFGWMRPASEQPWGIASHGLLKLVLLSAVGALAGFCLKILRAYLNMRERNLHRQRVANSIEAFVMSGQTPEVRDFILAQLVEAVASFGVSGLLSRETDSLGSHRTADAANRLVSSLSGAGKSG